MKPDASARYQKRNANTCVDCGKGSTTHRCAKCKREHAAALRDMTPDEFIHAKAVAGSRSRLTVCACGAKTRGSKCYRCKQAHRLEKGLDHPTKNPPGPWIDAVPSLQTAGGERARAFVLSLDRDGGGHFSE